MAAPIEYLMNHYTMMPGPVNHPTQPFHVAPNGVTLLQPPFPIGPPGIPYNPFICPYLPHVPMNMMPPDEEPAFAQIEHDLATITEVNDEDREINEAQYVPPPQTDVAVSFSSSTARYNGITDVRPFINEILNFKKLSGMNDETALRSLPLLFSDLASAWWQNKHAEITDWNTAVAMMRKKFRNSLQPHKVYRNLIHLHQNDDPTVVFEKAKKLLRQLPPCTITETEQLDLVYCMFDRRIHKIDRDDYDNFDEFLEQARKPEETFEKASANDSEHEGGAGSSKQYIVKDIPEPSIPPFAPIKPRVIKASGSPVHLYRACDAIANLPTPCDTCKKYGLLFVRMCQKFHQRSEEEVENLQGIEEHSNVITCYRCRSSNILRMKCQDCLGPFKPERRPVMTVTIFRLDFDIVLDTGARNSIATTDLFTHFAENGVEIRNEDVNISVRGDIQRRMFRIATVDVWLGGVIVPTTFFEVPEASENVLGIDFIRKAGLILDFRNEGKWCIRGNPNNHPMYFEEFEVEDEEA